MFPPRRLHHPRCDRFRADRGRTDAPRRRLQHPRRKICLVERRARARVHLGHNRRLYPARPQRERVAQLPLLNQRRTAPMKNYRKIAAALWLLTAALPAVASANPPIAAEAAAANFEQDPSDILAMAGNYRVSFNMQESTRWDPD